MNTNPKMPAHPAAANPGRMRGLRTAGMLVLLLVLSPTLQARINVVTLPGRDSVQLTIYNSADLTLVKETRLLTFRQGINRLEFSWANTLIDPTSLEFRALTHGDEVDILDVSFPPRVTNTLEWRIQSEFAGEVEVEIRYFTSGISWSADYVAEASTDEKEMALAGHVRVHNQSGEDYDNAQIRLVVGVIRLVENIADLAKPGRPGPGPEVPAAPSSSVRRDAQRRMSRALGVAEGLSRAKKKEIVKEGLSEYFLYTVEGRDTVKNGWSKRLPSFQKSEIPVTSFYKFEKERWADQVMRFYRITNAVPSNLGDAPLPDGSVQAFRVKDANHLYEYVGRTQVKYIPVNETVDMELGPDQEVLVKPKLMDWQKFDLRMDARNNVVGWTIRESWQIELQNSKNIQAVLDVRRNFQGDWEIKTEDAYEKVDATKVKFVVPLDSREKQTLAYEVITHHGTNIRK